MGGVIILRVEFSKLKIKSKFSKTPILEKLKKKKIKLQHQNSWILIFMGV